MLWLCFHFPKLPVSALGTTDERTVVVDQRGSKRWLITGNADVEAGTSLSSALSLFPDLPVRARRPEAEAETLRALAWWAYRFGQPVAAEIQDLEENGRSPRALLWVEIGASLALFGGLDALRDQVCSELIGFGHAARIGIAPTRAGAALLAVAGRSDPVTDSATMRGRLMALPLSILHWRGAVLDALLGIGLKKLGDVLALPRAAFARRFGHERLLDLDRLTGDAPDPCVPIVPPEVFRRRFELPGEVEDTQALVFPLRRLCGELEAYLRTRDRGLRGVTLVVRHASARETQVTARFVDPHRDAKRLFDALHERLERDGLPLAARELVLVAEDFADPVVPQEDLFDAASGRAQAWAAAIERLRGRLGDAAVWTPEVMEEHRPECAMRQAVPGTKAPHPGTLSPSRRPSLLVPDPWPMPPPADHSAVERIESGWWQGDVRRDYCTVEMNGTRAWVFRDVTSGQWFLHGWWA